MTNEQLALALDIYGNNVGCGIGSFDSLDEALGRYPIASELTRFWREINKRMDLDLKWAALEAVARLRREKGE